MDKYGKYIKLLDNHMAEKYPTIFGKVTLKIIPKFIFLKKTPLIFGVTVKQYKLNIWDNIGVGEYDLGKVIGLKLDSNDVTSVQTLILIYV